MNVPCLETKRLILRSFEEGDLRAFYFLLKDEEVNTFLPWFPVKNMAEAELFYEERFSVHGNRSPFYCYAVCLKEKNDPIGYITVNLSNDSHDFGYALRKEFWHRGLMTEAGKAVISQLMKDGITYITATHDKNNPSSGAVMRRLGMKYQYSYEEQCQPKNFLVTFRMYQLNLDGREDRVYQKYWETSDVHWIEENI